MYNMNIFPWRMDTKAVIIAATCMAAALGVICVTTAVESFTSFVTKKWQ